MVPVPESQPASVRRGNAASFGLLPWEMREAIWNFCLPEDVLHPRLFFAPGRVFEPATVSEQSFQCQYIDPVLLVLAHTCSQSRRAAMRHITVRVDDRGRRILCKRFLPERDCVFLTSHELDVAISYAEGGAEDDGSAVVKSPLASAVRHVAISHHVVVLEREVVFRLLSALPSLRLLLVNFQGPILPVGPGAGTGHDMRGLRVADLEKGEDVMHGDLVLYGPGLSTMLETRRSIVMVEAMGLPGGPWDMETGELFVKFVPANIWRWGDDDSVPGLTFAV